MATVKIKFAYKEGHAFGRIYYQIIHARKVRRIFTGIYLKPSEWSVRRSVVLVHEINARVRQESARIHRVIKSLDEAGVPYTADEAVAQYNMYVDKIELAKFMDSLIFRLKASGRIRTAETYRSAFASFHGFRQGHPTMLDAMTADMMEDYQLYLKMRGLTLNSVSFYMRILRAAYNQAVSAGLIDQRMPFRSVYTGIGKTVKRAVPIAVMRKIKRLDLSGLPALDYARDMFLMSFYLRGMSFVDMAYLRKSDLAGGYVSYRRRKTGQSLIIKWTREMKTIAGKYPVNVSDYLLPILRGNGVCERSTYRNAAYRINKSLKKIGIMLGIDIPLTMYVARHSWASAAKAKGVPLSIISQGMGHDSEATTRIYLASLDTSLIDKANAAIISSI